MLNGYLAYLETKFTTATIFLCTLAEMALDFKEKNPHSSKEILL